MKDYTRFALLVAMIHAAFQAHTAGAAPLPDAVIFTASDGGFTTTATLGSDPSVSVAGSFNGVDDNEGVAAEEYFFEIAGPDGAVPVRFIANGFAAGGTLVSPTTGGAIADFLVALGEINNFSLGQPSIVDDPFQDPTDVVHDFVCGVPGPIQAQNFYPDYCRQYAFDSTFGVDQVFDLSANQIYSVFLWTGALVGPNVPGASAAIDPKIFIDPGFAGGGDYRLIFSAGVTAGSPLAASAAEPPAFALFSVSLMGLALPYRQWWSKKRPATRLMPSL